MNHKAQNIDTSKDQDTERIPYQAPTIIFEGDMTTRAGSPTGGTNGSGIDGVDPADLFGN